MVTVFGEYLDFGCGTFGIILNNLRNKIVSS